MPGYPGYGFAGSCHHDRRRGERLGLDASFLRVFRDEAGLLRAGLHPNGRAGVPLDRSVEVHNERASADEAAAD